MILDQLNFPDIALDTINNYSKKSTSIGDEVHRQHLEAISFQIMTCAEPPELVIKTIKSLLTIKEERDEILIIDNNNTQTEKYTPLAAFCNSLDPNLRVRFYHEDAIEGYKAGALNLALKLMDSNSSHIVVVDSDYQALPHARLSIANALIRYPNHTLLQFPQFYRTEGQQDVHSELNHYFNYHLYRPFNRNKALSTGTFAVIRHQDLINLGGWSGASITEDAQMGVLMHRNGYRSQFIPEVIATGLLPNSLKDLVAQRRRWIYGNVQVLKNLSSVLFEFFDRCSQKSSLFNSKSSNSKSSKPSFSNSSFLKKSHMSDGSMDTCAMNDDYIAFRYLDPNLIRTESVMPQKKSMFERLAYLRAHLSQLTAWINFTGPFIGLHIGTLLLATGTVFYPISKASIVTHLSIVYTGYAVFLVRRLWAYLQDQSPLNQQLADSIIDDIGSINIGSINIGSINEKLLNGGLPKRGLPNRGLLNGKLRAWLMHLNFWELGALSWLPVLWGQSKPFVCTPKDKTKSISRSAWINNLRASPKLVFLLNMTTAAMVSPFSPFYSPLLLISALSICALKLAALKVAVDNFASIQEESAVKQPINKTYLAFDNRMKNGTRERLDDVISDSKGNRSNKRLNDKTSANDMDCIGTNSTITTSKASYNGI